MAILFKGAIVAAALGERIMHKGEALERRGISPTLAILRVGEREDDLSYERSATKRCQMFGGRVKSIAFPEAVEPEVYYEAIEALNADANVHGVLMLRPLPEHIDGEKARLLLCPGKDVDGCTEASLAGVFAGTDLGFAPCTAQAAVEILDHYGVPCEGQRVAVLGRSLVAGRPAAMMLMNKNATVTICHSKTEHLAEITRAADIVVVATGKMESLGAEYFARGQVVIDISSHWNAEKNKFCGDVKFDEVEPLVGAITPVPGGVRAATATVLVDHVFTAALKSCQ